MKRMLLLLGGLAVIVAVVTALALQSPDHPGNGISASDAIQRAWEHSDQGAVTVRSAEIKRNFVTGFELPTHHWAWVVTFNGQWHLLCSGHVTDGSCDPTSEWVAIDYYTGQWIASQHSYPAAPRGGSRRAIAGRQSTTVVVERGRDKSRMSETMPHPIRA